MKLFTLNDPVVNISQRIAHFSLCSPPQLTLMSIVTCRVVLPYIDTTCRRHSNIPNTTEILGMNINRPV